MQFKNSIILRGKTSTDICNALLRVLQRLAITHEMEPEICGVVFYNSIGMVERYQQHFSRIFFTFRQSH